MTISKRLFISFSFIAGLVFIIFLVTFYKLNKTFTESNRVKYTLSVFKHGEIAYHAFVRSRIDFFQYLRSPNDYESSFRYNLSKIIAVRECDLIEELDAKWTNEEFNRSFPHKIKSVFIKDSLLLKSTVNTQLSDSVALHYAEIENEIYDLLHETEYRGRVFLALDVAGRKSNEKESMLIFIILGICIITLCLATYKVIIKELSLERKHRQILRFNTRLMNSLHDPIISTDSNYNIKTWNCAAEKLYGYKKEEVIGKPIKSIIKINYISSSYKDALRTINESGNWNGYIETYGRDGEKYQIHAYISLIKDSRNNVEALVGVHHNVTNEKKRLAEINNLNTELQKAHDNLIEVNKELESFSYSVSHDLRAPVRIINGYARMLLDDYGMLLPNSGLDRIRVILDHTIYMDQLIDDMLFLSRVSKQELVKKEIDMTELCKKAVIAIGEENASIINIGDLGRAYGDKRLIIQVFINLISNAIKYSRNSKKKAIEITCFIKEGRTIYSVKDFGAGFNMRYYERLFQLFQRLHGSEYEGSGVGLAIVHRIIKKHGGEIWAESVIGEGSIFYFTLN